MADRVCVVEDAGTQSFMDSRKSARSRGECARQPVHDRLEGLHAREAAEDDDELRDRDGEEEGRNGAEREAARLRLGGHVGGRRRPGCRALCGRHRVAEGGGRGACEQCALGGLERREQAGVQLEGDLRFVEDELCARVSACTSISAVDGYVRFKATSSPAPLFMPSRYHSLIFFMSPIVPEAFPPSCLKS